MNNLIIQVTEGDIQKGLKENCLLCPLSLAYERVIGITQVYEDFAESEKYGTIFHSSDIIRWIKNFDLGFPVKSFDFQLKFISEGEGIFIAV